MFKDKVLRLSLYKGVDNRIRVCYPYKNRGLFINLIIMVSENQKRERFKRLAIYRTNEVLKKLKILGNCANRSAYSYTEKEINKIFSEIERKVKEVKSRFHFPEEKEFKL